jgi:hypothetical protein
MRLLRDPGLFVLIDAGFCSQMPNFFTLSNGAVFLNRRAAEILQSAARDASGCRNSSVTV